MHIKCAFDGHHYTGENNDWVGSVVGHMTVRTAHILIHRYYIKDTSSFFKQSLSKFFISFVPTIRGVMPVQTKGSDF